MAAWYDTADALYERQEDGPDTDWYPNVTLADLIDEVSQAYGLSVDGPLTSGAPRADERPLTEGRRAA